MTATSSELLEELLGDDMFFARAGICYGCKVFASRKLRIVLLLLLRLYIVQQGKERHFNDLMPKQK